MHSPSAVSSNAVYAGVYETGSSVYVGCRYNKHLVLILLFIRIPIPYIFAFLLYHDQTRYLCIFKCFIQVDLIWCYQASIPTLLNSD